MKLLYAWFLYLFPRSYRLEYGEELQTVFELSLDEAKQIGKVETARVILHEMISLPRAILYQQLRERRKMSGGFLSRFDFARGSWREILAGVAPFFMILVLPSVFRFINSSTNLSLLVQIIVVLFFGFLAGSLYVIGFTKKLPRWFMPYLGLPLPIITLLTFSILIDPEWHGLDPLYHSSWFIGAFVSEGLMWVTLIFLVLMAILMVFLIPTFRPVYRRIREDWTLASFLLYGIAPIALVFTFDEYQNEEPYLFAGFFILATGAWLYLRTRSPWKRFLALFFGFALAMSVAALGKWILFVRVPGYGFTNEREALSTVIQWSWLATIMLLPAIINLFPRSIASSPTFDTSRQEG